MKTEYKLNIMCTYGGLRGVVTLSDKKGTAATWKFDYWTKTCTRSINRRGLAARIADAALTHSKFLQVEYFFEQLRDNRATVKF